MNDFLDFECKHGKKVTLEDRKIIGVQTIETLFKWYHMLNTWEWPDKLPNEEKPQKKYSIYNRRHQIMKFLQCVVGTYYILRNWNENMTDEEFLDFWIGHYDIDARKRYEEKVKMRLNINKIKK